MSDTTGARRDEQDPIVTGLLKRDSEMKDAGIYDVAVLLVQSALLKSRRS